MSSRLCYGRVRRLRGNQRPAGLRSGAAVVEAALMMPVLVIITFGSIDLAQYINSGQVVINASREGARVASRDQTLLVSDVENTIRAYLAASLPQLTDSEMESSLIMQVKDITTNTLVTDQLDSVPSGNKLAILVELDFESIRWLRGPGYSPHRVQTYCRRE